MFDTYIVIENPVKDSERSRRSQSRAIEISSLSRETSRHVDMDSFWAAFGNRATSTQSYQSCRATSRLALKSLVSRIVGQWCWSRIFSALPMCSEESDECLVPHALHVSSMNRL